MTSAQKGSDKGSFKTFFVLLALILLWSMFFGGFKFLIKNIAHEPLGADPAELLEHTLALLSVGGFIAYIIGGIVCSTFSMRAIVFRDAAIAAILLLIHYYWGMHSQAAFNVVVVIIGIFYGVFAVVRNISTYIEMVKTKLPDTTVNGVATITFLVSLIIGVFISTRLYEACGDHSFWVFFGILVLISMISPMLNYKEFEDPVSIGPSCKKFISEVKWIFMRRYMVVIPAASLWSIATIVSIKSIPYAQQTYEISESLGSLIMLFSAVGAIVGNILTVRIRNRWLAFRLFTYAFAALIVLFYVLTKTYVLMVAYSTAVGLCMGGATNLIDAYYLKFVGENGKKENGAALYGIVLNAVLASLIFCLTFVPDRWDFLVMGILTVGLGIFVRITLPLLREE